MFSRSVVSNSLQPHGLQPTRLPCPWDSPGQKLEWVAMPFSRGSSQPRDWTQVSCIAGGFFTSWATREVQKNVYMYVCMYVCIYIYIYINTESLCCTTKLTQHYKSTTIRKERERETLPEFLAGWEYLGPSDSLNPPFKGVFHLGLYSFAFSL